MEEVAKPKKDTSNYKGRPHDTRWVDEYLEKLAKRNTPYIIVNEIGWSWQTLHKLRKDSAEFKAREAHAIELYEERVYQKVESLADKAPLLYFKFAERVCKKLAATPAKVEINTENHLTLVGLNQQQCFDETQRLINQYKLACSNDSRS